MMRSLVNLKNLQLHATARRGMKPEPPIRYLLYLFVSYLMVSCVSHKTVRHQEDKHSPHGQRRWIPMVGANALAQGLVMGSPTQCTNGATFGGLSTFSGFSRSISAYAESAGQSTQGSQTRRLFLPSVPNPVGPAWRVATHDDRRHW